MFIEGIVDILRVPIAFILKICHSFCNMLGVGNYLFALLLFAIIMQILLLPFGIKQQKNSIRQASFAPKIAAIRNKYKGRNDKATQQKIQQETMDLYSKENFNPMGGCLPLLIQMPILFALFRVITMPLRYLCSIPTDAVNKMVEICNKLSSNGSVSKVVPYANIASNDGYAQIKLVSNLRALGEGTSNQIARLAGAKDFAFSKLPDFKMFGGKIDLSEAPSAVVERDGFLTWMILIPIITIAALIFSQWLTKKFTYQAPESKEAQKGCGMKVMLYAMPLLSGYFAYIVAAAIGIYWIFRNLLSLLQQIILSKTMPLPVFTEEDYKQAEREMFKTQVRKKSTGERDPNRPKVRSLHHIDDDDEEEYTDNGKVTKYDEEGTDKKEDADDASSEKAEKGEKSSDSKSKKSSSVAAAPIKEDKGRKFKKK